MIVHPPPMALPDGLLTLEDILPATHRGRNITHEMHQRFFIDIPDEESHRIEWRHGCVVGKPGCGKSETFKARAEYAVKKYGKSNINLVYVDDLRTAIEMIDDRPVQYCIIDDAAKSMSSREIHEQTEILGTFNRLRHYFRKFISTESGVFLCEFGWQRWAELDPGFRDGTSLIFKTNMSSEFERRSIQDFIGTRYMGILDDIWDSMDRGNQAIKSYSVGRIGPKAISRGGVGIYHLPMTKWDGFPQIVTAAEHEASKIPSDPLEPWRNDPQWARPIEIYDKHMAGARQSDIASEYGINQATVSRTIARVRELTLGTEDA